MRFATPWALALLPLVAAWAVWGARRRLRGRATLPFSVGHLLAGVRAPRFDAPRWVPLILRAAALLLLVVAAARPQQVLRRALPPNSGVDILLAIDTSPSMQALDIKPGNRLEAARRTARDFIQKRVNDRIGIVVFGGSAFISCPLTLDYESLLDFLDHVAINMTESDGTAIGDAIATAVNHLRGSQARSKVIVLLTDGRSNQGFITDPVLAAKTASSFGIKIYTIGTARKGKAPYPVQHPVYGTIIQQVDDDLDEETLQKIAQETAGEYYRAESLEQLQSIYDRIDALERSEVDVPEVVSYIDLFHLLLVPALALLALETVLTRTLLMTLP